MTNNAYYRAALAKKHIPSKRLKVGKSRGAYYCEVSSTHEGTVRNEADTEQAAITLTINEMDGLQMVNWHSLEIAP
ncbi:MAG: hypothetical protein PHE17_20150 [Thiothrix sp.]|uniref:hypothetical protein n=1 Tax=Thiothrix sp. TaxID=1032 RepID=UPI00262DE817|nr:hypothetical protein [Thiothrix sp.]MDD5395343.1 hypothetical protein [Thiothrix sp.]